MNLKSFCHQWSLHSLACGKWESKFGVEHMWESITEYDPVKHDHLAVGQPHRSENSTVETARPFGQLDGSDNSTLSFETTQQMAKTSLNPNPTLSPLPFPALWATRAEAPLTAIRQLVMSRSLTLKKTSVELSEQLSCLNCRVVRTIELYVILHFCWMWEFFYLHFTHSLQLNFMESQ